MLLSLVSQNFVFDRYIGIDISRVAIRSARANLPQAVFYEMDFTEGDFPDEIMADINICSEVIEHLENWEQVLGNIINCTKNGGTIIITTQAGKRHKSDLMLGHLKHFSLNELIDAIREKGCQIQEAYRTGFPFYNLQKMAQSMAHNTVSENITSKNDPGLLIKCLYKLGFLSFMVCPKNKIVGPQLFLSILKDPFNDSTAV